MRSFHLAATAAVILLGWAGVATATQGTQPRTPPAPTAGPVTAVSVGQEAPDFTLSYLVPKADGGFEQKQVRLSEYRNRQNVVLAFFPAAFSPG